MEEQKQCSKCNKIKPLSEFYYRKQEQRYRGECKECVIKRSKKYRDANIDKVNEYQKQYRDSHVDERKAYNQEHKEEHKEKRKAYYIENKDKIRKRKQKYYQENRDKEIEKALNYFHNNKEERHKYNKQYRDTHKEELAKRRRKDRENDIFKMKDQVRNLIGDSFRRRGYTKKSHTYEIVGLEWQEFYEYLLNTFKNNYGYEWDGIEPVHIDHIKPLSMATTEEDVIKLCYYTNLQLLKAKDNLEKQNKTDYVISDN